MVFEFPSKINVAEIELILGYDYILVIFKCFEEEVCVKIICSINFHLVSVLCIFVLYTQARSPFQHKHTTTIL